MECKYPLLSGINVLKIVVIETLWNVNLFYLLVSTDPYLVVIETLWNVNSGRDYDNIFAVLVVIETLWNVNDITAFKEADGTVL